MSRKTVSRILNERGAVTTDVSLRLSKALDMTPELWLNLQRNYDLWHTANEATDWQAIRPILKIAHVIEYKMFAASVVSKLEAVKIIHAFSWQ